MLYMYNIRTIEHVRLISMKPAGKMAILHDGEGNIVNIEDIQESTKLSVAGLFLECRKERGLTQQQLANVSGVDRANIARFENTNYNPTVEMLTRLAASMGKKLVISLEEDESDRQKRILEAYASKNTGKKDV